MGTKKRMSLHTATRFLTRSGWRIVRDNSLNKRLGLNSFDRRAQEAKSVVLRGE